MHLLLLIKSLHILRMYLPLGIKLSISKIFNQNLVLENLKDIFQEHEKSH